MNVLNTAADLLGPLSDDESVHSEYRRAVVEMCVELLGFSHDEGTETVIESLNRRREVR